MSQAGALTRARALRTELLARGVPAVSIELQQGRPGTPNNRWYDTRFIGSMGHHIVSSRNTGGLTPGLSLVKRGRSDVPGPLCNAYLGWDNVARIICMGWANHPGAGGPYTLPGGRIPLNGARPYLFGWEIEGGINLSDWTPAFRQLMGRCHAATLAWLKRDERSHIEHKTWAPSRKIDRLGYSLTGARNELKPHLSPPPPRSWLDMATKNDVKAAVREVLREQRSLVGLAADTLPPGWNTSTDYLAAYGAMAASPTGRTRQAGDVWKHPNAQQVVAELSALREAVGEILEHDSTNPLTKDDLEEAVERGLQRVRVEVAVVDDGADKSDG